LDLQLLIDYCFEERGSAILAMLIYFFIAFSFFLFTHLLKRHKEKLVVSGNSKNNELTNEVNFAKLDSLINFFTLLSFVIWPFTFLVLVLLWCFWEFL